MHHGRDQQGGKRCPASRCCRPPKGAHHQAHHHPVQDVGDSGGHLQCRHGAQGTRQGGGQQQGGNAHQAQGNPLGPPHGQQAIPGSTFCQLGHGKGMQRGVGIRGQEGREVPQRPADHQRHSCTEEDQDHGLPQGMVLGRIRLHETKGTSPCGRIGSMPSRQTRVAVLCLGVAAAVPLLHVLLAPTTSLPGSELGDVYKHAWSYWHCLAQGGAWPETSSLNAPAGGRLLDVMLAPALLMAPVTVLLGPVFSANLWVWLSLWAVGLTIVVHGWAQTPPLIAIGMPLGLPSVTPQLWRAPQLWQAPQLWGLLNFAPAHPRGSI